jgi:hypothetical protein
MHGMHSNYGWWKYYFLTSHYLFFLYKIQRLELYPHKIIKTAYFLNDLETNSQALTCFDLTNEMK